MNPAYQLAHVSNVLLRKCLKHCRHETAQSSVEIAKETVTNGVTSVFSWRFEQEVGIRSMYAEMTAATDKVHDLQLVIIGKLGCIPTLARYQFPVKFDRYAIRLHAQAFEQ